MPMLNKPFFGVATLLFATISLQQTPLAADDPDAFEETDEQEVVVKEVEPELQADVLDESLAQQEDLDTDSDSFAPAPQRISDQRDLYTEPCVEECQSDPCCHRWLLEAKAAYFFFTDSRIRDIFSTGTGIYGLEVSYQAWNWLYGWASGSFLTKEGHSTAAHHRTHVTLVPLALGLKFVHSFNCFDFYAGLGALYSYFHTKDHSPYVIPSTSKWGWGGTAKVGLLFYPYKCLFIDIFSDYSYMKFDVHKHSERTIYSHDPNFSGVSIGGGIGWQF